MADYGTVTLLPKVKALLTVSAFSVPVGGVSQGPVTLLRKIKPLRTIVPGSYSIVGTYVAPPCPDCPPAPSPPTDGQIWPLTFVQGG